MTPDINFGSPTVSGQVEVSSVPFKKTASYVQAQRTSNGTTDLGTPASGKVWRILAYTLIASNDDSTTTNRVADFRINGSVVENISMETPGTYGDGVAVSNVTFDYQACPVVQAGQDIEHKNTATDYSQLTVWYIEEDA